MKKKSKVVTKYVLMIITIFSLSCMEQENINLDYYYEYDSNIYNEIHIDTLSNNKFSIKYSSVNNNSVTSILTIPSQAKEPHPLVIIQHGLGDNKDTDYMQLGDSIFTSKGYAVFRIDFAMHGERVKKKYKFKSINYTLRDAVIQTVFDLRIGLDYLETRTDIDHSITGYVGISLGGIAGSVFCGVDHRIEYPVICIAGGGLRLMEGTEGFSDKITSMMAPIEPINYIWRISPRPVLFINAENDEVFPKPLSMLLHSKANDPKKTIWYNSGHKIDPYKAFNDSVEWIEYCRSKKLDQI